MFAPLQPPPPAFPLSDPRARGCGAGSLPKITAEMLALADRSVPLEEIDDLIRAGGGAINRLARVLASGVRLEQVPCAHQPRPPHYTAEQLGAANEALRDFLQQVSHTQLRAHRAPSLSAELPTRLAQAAMCAAHATIWLEQLHRSAGNLRANFSIFRVLQTLTSPTARLLLFGCPPADLNIYEMHHSAQQLEKLALQIDPRLGGASRAGRERALTEEHARTTLAEKELYRSVEYSKYALTITLFERESRRKIACFTHRAWCSALSAACAFSRLIELASSRKVDLNQVHHTLCGRGSDELVALLGRIGRHTHTRVQLASREWLGAELMSEHAFTAPTSHADLAELAADITLLCRCGKLLASALSHYAPDAESHLLDLDPASRFVRVFHSPRYARPLAEDLGGFILDSCRVAKLLGVDPEQKSVGRIVSASSDLLALTEALYTAPC